MRIHINEIKGSLYAKIPDIVAKQYDIKNNDNLEITIHNKNDVDQVEIWSLHPEDLDGVNFFIGDEVHTMNMYNRIYVPEKYRFFFPIDNINFLLNTNVGKIKTLLSNNGYISKGLRHWFHSNGPVMPRDLIKIILLNENNREYQMTYIKNIEK